MTSVCDALGSSQLFKTSVHTCFVMLRASRSSSRLILAMLPSPVRLLAPSTGANVSAPLMPSATQCSAASMGLGSALGLRLACASSSDIIRLRPINSTHRTAPAPCLSEQTSSSRHIHTSASSRPKSSAHASASRRSQGASSPTPRGTPRSPELVPEIPGVLCYPTFAVFAVVVEHCMHAGGFDGAWGPCVAHNHLNARVAPKGHDAFSCTHCHVPCPAWQAHAQAFVSCTAHWQPAAGTASHRRHSPVQ